MKKKTIIMLLIAAVAIAAAAAVFVINRPDEIAVTMVETVETPAETEEALAAEVAETADVIEAEAEGEEVVEIYGGITEIADEYVMILADGLGDVKVMLTEDTIVEGVEALEIGQTAKVLYTGMMTRSLPPQITALLIGVYAVTGEVTEAGDGRVTLMSENGEVILTLPEGAEAPAVGDAITAYTTGVSTMSLPPQMNAVAIETADSVG